MNSQQLVDVMHKHMSSLANSTGAGRNMNVELTMALRALADNQRIVSSSIPGCIPSAGEVPSKDAMRTYVLAIMVELSEFLQELDWKPWKTKKMDPEKVAMEFADVLAFMGVLLVYLEHAGIPEEMLAEAYRQKSIINMERFLGEHDVAYQQLSLLGKGK